MELLLQRIVDGKDKEAYIDVSILVLMELLLQPDVYSQTSRSPTVSILVLMELLLQPELVYIKPKQKTVSILVLMELLLQLVIPVF